MIKINRNKKVWFTADTHFGHRNIIKYCNRPFVYADTDGPYRLTPDEDLMDYILIHNWNKLVKPNDVVIHGGDFAFRAKSDDYVRSIINQLNGEIYLILGNHDFDGVSEQNRELFHHVTQRLYCQIWVPDQFSDTFPKQGKHWQKVIVDHYAMLTWPSKYRGAFQLYGHSHGKLPEPIHTLQFDIGVDIWNYQPISWENVLQILTCKLESIKET